MDSKMAGIILTVIGIICIVFDLVIVVTNNSWFSTAAIGKCGLSDCDRSGSWDTYIKPGDSDDDLQVTLGTTCTALGLVFIGTILAILACVGSAFPQAGIVGLICAFIAMVLQLTGWSYFYDKVGSSSGVDTEYGFALAIIVWILLLIWILLFFLLHQALSGGGGETQECNKASAPAGEVGVGMGSQDVKIEIQDGKATNVTQESLDYHDYNVSEDGTPVAVFDKSQKGQFRCAGDSVMSFGFQLTANDKAPVQDQQQGHFMCLVEFEATGSEVNLRFEYNMFGAKKEGGAGLCAYLVDPSVEGWDTVFNGTGPMGFIGKTGAIVGVALDNTGDFTGDGKADHLTIKGAKEGAPILKSEPIEGGFMTTDEEWKQVHIKFDIKDNNCDVKLDGKKIMDDINFGDIKIPPKLCVAVCGAATDPDFMIAVNDVKLEDIDEDDAHHEHDIHTEAKKGHPDDTGEGIPPGCRDYKVEDGALVQSQSEEDWRCAGHTVVEYGFELTQDEDDQEGHLLCRVPFEVTSSEIHASLEYVMEPKSYAEGGGQGLCIYLCDPSVQGWDRSFDGSGPLGFVGKTGAILGVGIDCTGTFCKGEPASVAVKRASDNELLCKPVTIAKVGDAGADGVKTEEDEWRKVKIKFDIDEMKVDVTIGGHKYLDDVPIDLGKDADGNPVKIPRTVCIGVCAGTAEGKNNHICVNDVRLEAEESED
jgi:hypothetical protein